MIAIVKFKKHMIRANIFNIILYKLNYWLEFCLIILLIFIKNLKINLFYTILIFCLVINLIIEYHRKLLFNIKKIAKKNLEF